MSSVPKSRRYPTDAKFITELKELKAITIRKCTKFPKRYNATVADHLLKSVLNGKHLAYQANAVFPRTKGQTELRKLIDMTADGIVELNDVLQSWQSWKGYASFGNSYHTVKNMEAFLYRELSRRMTRIARHSRQKHALLWRGRECA